MPDGGAYLGKTTLILDADATPLDRELAEARARAELTNREMARNAKAATDQIVADSTRGATAYKDQAAAVDKVAERIQIASGKRIDSERAIETQVGRTQATVSRATQASSQDAEKALELTKLREQAVSRLEAAEQDASQARQRAQRVDRDLNRDALNEYKAIADAKGAGYKLTQADIAQANQRIAKRREEAAANRDAADALQREATNLRVIRDELDGLARERERTMTARTAAGRRHAEGTSYVDELQATNAPAAEVRRVREYTDRLGRNLGDLSTQLEQVDGVIGERVDVLRQAVQQEGSISDMEFFTRRKAALRQAVKARDAARMRELNEIAAPARISGRSEPGGPLGGPGAAFSPPVRFPAQSSPISPERAREEVDRIRQAGLRAGTVSQQVSGLGAPFAQGRSVEGVKGPDHGGSRANPITTVLKSGKSAGLSSSESADIAAASTTDPHPLARSFAQDMAAMRRGPDRPMRQPFSVGDHITVDLSDDSINRFSDAMEASLLEPLRDMVSRIGAGGDAGTAKQFALESTGRQHRLYEVGPDGQRKQLAESTSLEAIKAAMRSAELSRTRNEMQMGDAARRLQQGQPLSMADRPRWQGGRVMSNADILAMAKAEEDNTAALQENTAAQIAAGGGGGGGGGAPPVALGAGGGGGGGGGGEGHDLLGLGLAGLLTGRKKSHGRPPGWLGYLLGPAIGAGAAAGSIASFAGFGTEHILTTLGGIVGSGVAGATGAGLMGLGAAGQMAVGGGSDMAVMRSTIADTGKLKESYVKLQEAVAKYGAGSKQATVAQNALNFAMKELGGGAGAKAELQLAKAQLALNKFWDHATSDARVQATKVLDQVLALGRAYVPLVARSADQNLSIIDDRIKPLMAWLKGPEGMGIFRTLERRFQENLPTAIHATSQGIELLLKTIREMSGYTGGLTAKVDAFLTKVNSPAGFAKWRNEMGRLVAVTRDWGAFLNIAWKVVRDLFSQDAETGRGIINALTEMLTKVHEWELSTTGKHQLSNIFLIHKEEVLTLLGALVPLVSAFTHLYMVVAPPLTKAATEIATVFANILLSIEKLGPAATTILGGALVAWKLGYLAATVKAIGSAFGFMGSSAVAGAGKTTAALDEQAAAAQRAAGAEAELAAAERAAGGGGVGGAPLPQLTGWRGMAQTGAGTIRNAASAIGPRLIRGGTYGVLGALGAEAAGSALGLKKPVQNALTGAIAGAATGAAFGPWGAAAGLVIGGALGGAFNLFSKKAPDYGRAFAKGFVAPLASNLTNRQVRDDEAELHKLQHASALAQKAEHDLLTSPKAGKPDFYGRATTQPLTQAERDQAFNRRFTAEQRVGLASAEVMKQEFGGVTHKTPTALTLFTASQMSHMTGEAKLAAGRSMVAYAAELEAKKELPKGAIHKMLTALESEFPSFQRYMRNHAMGTSAEVAAAQKLTGAESNLRTSLNNLKAEWGLFNLDPNVNGKNWIRNTGKAMKDLKALLTAEPGNKVLQKRIEELQTSTAHTFDKMLSSTKTKLGTFGKYLHAGIKEARPKAEQELAEFTGKVAAAEESGAISAKKGAELIGQATNAELKALGGSQIPAVALPVVGGVTAAAKQAFNAAGSLFAGGGLLQVGHPGEQGHDHIPLNVGGHPIVVGAGEQVAVFNRHQQQFMDHALAPVGGLHGMFSKVNTPHYMATGGFAPGLGGVDSGVATVASAVLRAFPGLSITSTTGGHHATNSLHYLKEAVDVAGASGVMNTAAAWLGKTWGKALEEGIHNPNLSIKHGHPVASSFWGEPTWGEHLNHIHIGVLGGSAVTGGVGASGGGAGAAAASWKSIKVPQVKGNTPMARMVNAGLRKMAHAANSYGEKHTAPKAGPSSGGKAAGNAQMRSWAKSGLEAAGVPATPGNISTIVARMIQESGGNPRSENRWDSNFQAGHPSRGLMELIPENFAKYHVKGTANNVFDPVANVAAAVRYMLGRYGHLVGSTGSGYAMGGMVPGFGGGGMVPHYFRGTKKATPHATTATAKKGPAPKAKPPKGSHVKKPKKAGHVSLGHLADTLSSIPGYGNVVKQMKQPEEHVNALDTEAGLLSEMASNPASLLVDDQPLLAPTMPPGLNLPTPELVTAAERQTAQYGLDHGESDQLSETSQLLQYVGAKDDHRLINKGQAALLGVKNYLPFPAGAGVFQSQKVVLEQQKIWLEATGRLEKLQVAKAAAFIRARQERIKKIRARLQKVYEHYRALHHALEVVKLNAAKGKYNTTEAANRAASAEADLGALIADEQAVPKAERNEGLINSLQAQRAHMHAHAAALRKASKAPIIEQELKMQIHPLEESMRVMGGASTHLGQAGRIGELGKQVKTLTGARKELEGQRETLTTATLPKLSLTLQTLGEQLAESAASVRPPKIKSGTESTALTEKQTQELQLQKETNQQLALALAVSQRQYSVLSRLPPFGGHFAAGGIVPGMKGEPRTIIAHGGEKVTPPGQGQPQVQVIVADGMGWLKQFIKVQVKSGTRTSARDAGRLLPSRGGGLT